MKPHVRGARQDEGMSTVFAAKSVPTKEKLRGGYYTPDRIAKFVANWVSAAGTKLLEPSCGDGAILQYLANSGSATGIELFEEEAEAARSRTRATVENLDFFAWFTPDHHGKFDGVAGNPPYIRFGNWEERYREPAFSLMKSEGLNPTRLTNAWLPFVVASLVAVRQGGRVGLVVPAELLQVGYAAELRSYLIDSCSEIAIIGFSELVFSGIQQEVVLLLATKGRGPAEIKTLDLTNAESLNETDLRVAPASAPLNDTEKWTKYFLEAPQINALRKFRADSRLHPLGNFASVNVGVVTGRNSFFCLTEEEAAERGISEHTINLLSRSAQFTGVCLTNDDLVNQARGGIRTRLLALEPDADLSSFPDLSSYISLGENEKVHQGYKCSIRDSWWSVPSIAAPSGFMLRQVSTYLRLTANGAGATSTDTVHRVFTRPGVDMQKLAVASLNSVTQAFSETMGRSYGGGVLEVEPREAILLPVPDPQLVTSGLSNKVDALLRRGEIEEALRLVNQEVLIDRLGFSREEVKQIHEASSKLRERRLTRGRKT